MHIPDGFLNIPTLIATNLVALSALIASLRKLNKKINHSRIPILGLAAAFIFTIQLLSFPIPGGTSMHLQGAVLISILLGPFSGFTIMSASLLLSAFFFQHGGLLTLGANCINNGLVGCFLGYYLFYFFSRKWLFSIGFAAFIVPIISAAFCALELGLSGMLPLNTALLAMVVSHFFSGLLETFVTVGVLLTIKQIRPALLQLEKI